MSTNKTILKIFSYILVFLFIIIIIPLHLFPGFISGFISYELIIFFTPWFRYIFINKARLAVVILLITIILILITLLIINLINLLTSDFQHDLNIINNINYILLNIKNHIPKFLLLFLPNNIEDLKNKIILLLESNLIIIRDMIRIVIRILLTIFIGIIIGAIISLNKPNNNHSYFINQLNKRIYFLSLAFHNIIIAQVRISLVNTLLTSIMIIIILPSFGIFVPSRKILIISTFLLGLIPIIGNLISNIVIIFSSLSVSLTVGVIILIYLIFIHKLEYVLNAEIVGQRTNTKSWELILVMLLLESIFGLNGLIAAPIYYAYLKYELKNIKII
ncbi:MAG: AI-2E family transporter [Candidatus Lightella neohaematopini]|nr:AI-2E family transporter [Candidatus Lightella neohaematopini]